MGQRICVVHPDAVVRADIIDALQLARPEALTLAFDKPQNLVSDLRVVGCAEMLLFDSDLRIPGRLLALFRWTVPLVFEPSAADTFTNAADTSPPSLRIPIRDEALIALLRATFGP